MCILFKKKSCKEVDNIDYFFYKNKTWSNSQKYSIGCPLLSFSARTVKEWGQLQCGQKGCISLSAASALASGSFIPSRAIFCVRSRWTQDTLGGLWTDYHRTSKKKLRIKQEIIGKITYFCHTHWQVTIFCKFTINWENVLIKIVYKQVSLFVLSAFYITEVKIFARGFMFRNGRCVK